MIFLFSNSKSNNVIFKADYWEWSHEKNKEKAAKKIIILEAANTTISQGCGSGLWESGSGSDHEEQCGFGLHAP